MSKAKRKVRKKPTTQDEGVAKKKRIRRTPEQIIEDYQKEIERLRQVQKAKEMKQSPSIKASFAAIKALDRALEVAADEGDGRMRHALADARRALGNHLDTLGVPLPKANLPKGPRPK